MGGDCDETLAGCAEEHFGGGLGVGRYDMIEEEQFSRES